MSNFRYIFITLFLCILSYNTSAQVTAFPDAEGFGRFATGGRGGAVIKVTNLNDSGPGSFRAALQTSGPRTIVFEVGGTINLNSNIYVSNGDLTVAGQTAPGDGILLRGGMFQIEASNVIVSHLRFRPGTGAPNDSDGISITAWQGDTVENVIVDHCSISWAKDENFDIRGVGGGIVRDITLQNSIISECEKGILGNTGCYNLTFYRNLLALNFERNIRTNHPISGTFDFEMINNLIYGYKWATVPSFGNKFTVLNNIYKLSSQFSASTNVIVDGEEVEQGNISETYAYISGNIIPASATINDSDLNPYLRSTPYTSTGIVPLDASQLDASMLNDVGATLPKRDAVDIRIVNNYINSDGTLATSGTYPNIQGGTALADTDDDGMPDTWETANGLDINNADDRNIVQSNGYTNLEHYLYNIPLNSGSGNVNAGADQNICEGDSITLTASGVLSYQWNTGETTASITVTPNTTTTYIVTGTNAQGETSTDSVTVTVNSRPTANAGEDVEICEGDEVILTASGGTTYLWSNGETSQTIAVSPTTTRNYSVTVTQDGCSSTDEVTVAVRPRQTINAGNDVDIYPGESTTLTVVGEGDILWSTGETTASITVTPDITTTYTVEVTETNGCTAIDEVTVTVIGTVNPNAGPDVTICEGEITVLTASGGDNYLWSTGETTQSITVNPNTTTTYTVEVSNQTASGSDEVTVFVNPVPNVSAGNDTEINIGEYVTLSASGADSYLWSNGATQPNIAVSPQETTTYYVTGYKNNCSDVADVTVTVRNAVSANAGADQSICKGESAILTASGGDSYLWSTGETTESITVTPDEDTTYTVIVSNDFDSDSDDVFVSVLDCNQNEEETEFQYNIYPNPTFDGMLVLQLGGITEPSKLYVHDVIGKLLHVETIDATDGSSFNKKLDISGFTNGIYLVTVEEKGRSTTKKIIYR